MKQRFIEIIKRLLKEPSYRFSFTEKLIRSIFIYSTNAIMYIIRRFLYKSISTTTLIYNNCSFRNYKSISLGKHVTINHGSILWANHNKGIIIDDYSQINPYVTIYGDVKIGKYVMIAPHVMIAGGNHGTKDLSIPMMFQSNESKGGVIIDDDVWIGANCVILDGVTISKGAIIAAGSVVTKNILEYEIVAGNPAKAINNRLNLI